MEAQLLNFITRGLMQTGSGLPSWLGDRFNFVNLGSIAATLVVIDQPLIHRAVSVATVQRDSIINATFSIAPEILCGYTAESRNRGLSQWVMSAAMISTFHDYNSQVPLNARISGSDAKSTITGFIKEAGLSAECKSLSTMVDYSGYMYANVVSPISPFSVAFDILQSTENISSQIAMTVAYTNGSDNSDGACSGLRTEKVCFISPATLLYPATGTGASNHWTIGGLYAAARSLFPSNATYSNSRVTSFTLSLSDTLSSQFLDLKTAPNTTTVRSGNLNGNFTIASRGGFAAACTANWTDPTEFILTALNNMAFRLAMKAAEQRAPYRNTNTSAPVQTASITATKQVPIYRAEYCYLVASAVPSFCMVLLVVPVFYGWWELGRTFSMNPVETAKAFDAPMPTGPGSNADLALLFKNLGARKVVLGEVVDVWETGMADGGRGPVVVRRRLRFGDPAEVAPPAKGILYD